MNLLKQLSILSIFLLAASPVTLAMEAPDAKKPKAEQSGSWFKAIVAGAGLTGAAGAGWVWTKLSNNGKSKIVDAVTGTPVIAAVGIPAGIGLGWLLNRAFFGTAEGNNSQDGLEITAEEQALLADCKDVNLAPWQLKMLAIMVACSNEKKDVLAAQAAKFTNPHLILSSNGTIKAIKEAGQTAAFQLALKSFTYSFVESAKAALAQTLTNEQSDINDALPKMDLNDLLTEKYKGKLSAEQVKFVNDRLSWMALFKEQQDAFAEIVKAEAELAAPMPKAKTK